MPKDFAGRANTNGRKTQRKTNRKKRTVSPKARVLFHGPSFSFGAIVGATLIIVAAYAPEWLEAPKGDVTTIEEKNTQPPKVVYEFPKILQESEVTADPSAYPLPEQVTSSEPQAFHIQAASFKSAADANGLRARLLLENLPATVDSAQGEERVWYRVRVGPFANRTLANRAMTLMREMYLTPILVN